MSFFPDSKIFLKAGPFTVTWYALLIMVGAIIAYEISKRNLKRVGYKVDDIDNMFIGSLVFGFLGARLWYVLFSDLGTYIANPATILAIWEGGLAIQGGLIGGALFCYFYTRKARINFIQAADLIVPNVLIAQALGRWGNFVNQEAHGSEVSFEFISKFPKFIQEGMNIGGHYYQPTFLYESVANLIGWILIVLVLKRVNKIRRGDLTYAYLMWYGVTRFFIEGLRTDSLMFLGLRMAQITSLVFVLVGVLGYFGVFRNKKGSRQPIVLWDFDGTLAASEPVIIETYKTLFRKYKPEFELSDDWVMGLIGYPLETVMFDHFPNDYPEKIVEFRSIQGPLLVSKLEAKPHAFDVLQSLKDKGYRMGVVSNRASESLNTCLDILNMHDFFEVVIGSSDVKETKPNPEGIDLALKLLGADRGGVVYIGDTVIDVMSGKNAGSFTIACLFDTMREQEIKNATPNRVVGDLAQILDVLEEDLEWTTTMM